MPMPASHLAAHTSPPIRPTHKNSLIMVPNCCCSALSSCSTSCLACVPAVPALGISAGHISLCLLMFPPQAAGAATGQWPAGAAAAFHTRPSSRPAHGDAPGGDWPVGAAAAGWRSWHSSCRSRAEQRRRQRSALHGQQHPRFGRQGGSANAATGRGSGEPGGWRGSCRSAHRHKHSAQQQPAGQRPSECHLYSK